ncbi:DUF3558 domain-containing protein [Nocardia sp. AG03]|uniref:DUF3558 domain-containing protein n=1 Tax=Nocardia sp. AG03 TaxID=3025312 RepID=UPI002418B6E4|nr:DUF3558 domain-containing protein [Nocardia sp. AG03]
MRTWHKAIPALAVVVGAISGCDNADPSTAAQPSTTAAPTTGADPDAALWDPCSLPDAALTAAGINTATREKDIAGVEFEGWKVCGWKDSATRYGFTVASGAHTIEEARARTDYTDFADLTIGPRPALRSRPAGSAYEYSCYITVSVPHGLVDFDVLNRHSANNPPDPCVEVERLARAFVTYLPSE